MLLLPMMIRSPSPQHGRGKTYGKQKWQLACSEQDACTHAYSTVEQPAQPVGSQVILVEIQCQCEIDHGVGSGDRDPKSRSGLACP
jgi:hypothetical protein